MDSSLLSVIDCMRDMHDGRLVLLAAVVCAIGTYASFALAHHAGRASGAPRLRWGAVSILASACTAWATHFIVLLAFKPGMPAAFDPTLTGISLACAILGIGAGVSISLRVRSRSSQFVAGLVVGSGVTALHYVGHADRAARHLRDRGIDVPDTLLAHVAPLGWEHISLTGDYLWSEIDKPRDRFMPLRTTGSVVLP